jgi:phosphoribosyl 1,2-cyclic phosphodiesterase
MRLEFLGVRGSTPVSGKDKNKYGGHSPSACLSLPNGEWIIIDAGTGIKKLGDRLARKPGEKPFHIHILLTHFHLDHIIGLPFFAPLYLPKANINFYADSSGEQIEKHLGGVMAGRYFPVKLRETASKKVFKKIPERKFTIGGLEVSCCPLLHPQGSLSYKIKYGTKQIVFATDTEHPQNGLDERLVAFARGADIFIYDAMFTPEEYDSGRQGWGHSTWLAATKVARAAAVHNLYFSHFNPDHSDKTIDRIVSLARQKFPKTFGAREGIELNL